MLAFPSMLVPAAEQAGIPVPPDPDVFEAEEFPQFQLFCCAQLGCAMSPGADWENAKVIAKVPMDKVKTVTHEELTKLGWIF